MQLRAGAVAYGGVKLFVRTPNVGLEPIELLTWQRTVAPVFAPPATGWSAENVYTPVLARNLNGTPYRDGSNNLYLYYNGDNNVGTDYDQVGLATGQNLNSLTAWPTNPVIPLGTFPSVDAGDAQICSVFHDGTEFIIYYQGNSTQPGDFTTGDKVRLALATSPDGKVITKLGQVIGPGPDGDAEDLYWFKLIPAGHDGLPRIYYAGKNASLVFGLMAAVSVSGSLKGPWTRVSNAHLFEHGTTVLGDAWFANGLYHFLYAPLTAGEGIQYATSADGVTIVRRRELLPRRSGEWDSNPYHAAWVVVDGVNYLLYNGAPGVGIGYSSAG
ncbi:MAG TPA: hypothetical protein VGX71_13575 [Pseudaminobacter sp.]|nr:hypothetical protein [Pseudaminobacter sp.]